METPEPTLPSERPHFWSLFLEPYEPREPSYQVVAQAARAVQEMDYEDPLYETVYEYWKTAVLEARRTEHSRVTTADEYIALVNREPTQNRYGTLSYEEIKQRVDIVQYAERFANKLIHAGGKYRCVCILPTHAENTASFWLYPKTNSYYCFGCRQGGDVIDLIKRMGDDPQEVAK